MRINYMLCMLLLFVTPTPPPHDPSNDPGAQQMDVELSFILYT